MNGDVLASYLKEHLLEAKQNLARVDDPTKKLATGDKIEPPGS
jgi:hypothetical protein